MPYLIVLIIFALIPIIGSGDEEPYYSIDTGNKDIRFDLVDPQTSPENIRHKVMLGFRVLLQTKKYASEYVGNNLSCTNCHFWGGNTLGGRNGSLSLVGVPSVYPRYSEKEKRVITLNERIDYCFMRSLNGKAPPHDSEIVEGIIAYLNWISRDVKDFPHMPWLQREELRSDHIPNAKSGAKIYAERCSACHRTNGQGAKAIPPLWGKGAFNDAAGMNNPKKLSSFIYLNMPYKNPVLSEEEALDVAAYVISQPRPHYTPPEANP